MTVKEFIQFTELAWMVIGFTSLFHLIILIDTQPDRKTRKTLKKIAKEKNVKRYVIVNTILRTYCKYYEKQKINEQYTETSVDITAESANNKISYEEWKAEIERKKPHKVKPRKVIPEDKQC